MEFCHPQDFLGEIHSARKNCQLTASFSQQKTPSNQGAEDARKIRQMKQESFVKFTLSHQCTVVNIGFLKEWKKT